MVVGYPGHLDVFLARLLSRRRRKPLVWDVLMSMYLIALDRGLGRKSPLSLRLLQAIEQRACRLPDRLIIDTPEYVDWLSRTYCLPAERFRLVPLGVDDSLVAAAVAPPAKPGPFRVVYHGTFIPNHGVLTIVRATELLRAEEGLVFQLIGEGPDRAAAQAYALEHNLQQVEFIEWMEGAALVEALARADVCLGAFGYAVQSLITVHNKIYEAMALGRPVITGDSPAVRRAFRTGEEIRLVPREDPAALAAAIQELRSEPDLRSRIAEGGRRAVAERYTIPSIGRAFAEHLREVVA
jgi:glycosyltransferase involved in cell wall biosynthesis